MKRKYIFFGLSRSGKASLIKLLVEDGLIDSVPYSNAFDNISNENNEGELCICD